MNSKKIFFGKSVSICIACILSFMITLIAAFSEKIDYVDNPIELRNQQEGKELTGSKKASIAASKDSHNSENNANNKVISDNKNSPDNQVVSHRADTTSIKLSTDEEPFFRSVELDESINFTKNIKPLKKTDVNNVKIDLFSDQTSALTTDQMEVPNKATSDAMNKFLPKDEAVVAMGHREDNSNFMITMKGENEIMNVLEFDSDGKPITDVTGQIETISLPMSEYQNQLLTPRVKLLEKAQQNLSNFENADDLQQKKDQYKQQKTAYDVAKKNRDDLDASRVKTADQQSMLDQAEKNFKVADEAFSAEDPEKTKIRLQNKVNQYSDKKTRVGIAEKNVKDLQDSLVTATKERADIESLFNENDSTQNFNQMQAAKNKESAIKNQFDDARKKLVNTKKNTYSTDASDFNDVFDDVTAQFVHDTEVMKSVKNNEDYKSYRDLVRNEIYKPTAIQSTMNELKNLTNFMADVNVGKVLRPLGKVDLGKPFRAMATKAKYKFSGKP